MKRILTLIALLSLTACGTADKEGITKQKTEQSREVSSMAAVDTEPKVERTIELEGSIPYPWGNYYSAEQINELVSSGEVVHLWSDAPAFEEYVLEAINYVHPEPDPDVVNPKDPEKYTKKVHDSRAAYINAFVSELEQRLPKKQEYFNQLQKVSNLLAADKTKAAKTALEKATQIRTGQ